jgi:arylsulfatase A-like enzyme
LRARAIAAGVVAAAVVAVVVMLAQDSEPPGPGVAKEHRAPNVLLILTDDQREGLEVMPETTRLFVRGGREFTNAYTTVPVCCPSRAGIFTGQYIHNHGVTTNSGVDSLDPDTTFQHLLQKAGYRTAMFGKYMNGWNIAPPKFDEWGTRIGRDRYYGALWNVQGAKETIDQYSTDFVADSAVDFLQRADEEDDAQPWFLYLAPDAPHAPSEAEPEYAKAEVPDWDVDPGVFERDPKGHYTTKLARTLINRKEGDLVRTKQYRALMSVDDLVADVHAAINELGEDEDTLAIFMSDNGYMWGEHGLSEKTLPYTESIRVPLLMRWPDVVETGSSDQRLVANIDLAPTILEATGVSGPTVGAMDGRSILDAEWQRDRLLVEHEDDPSSARTPTWASLRTNAYQYIEYYSKNGRIKFREYYDLVADPRQMVNVLADRTRGNNPDVETLSAQLADDRDCKGDDCP